MNFGAKELTSSLDTSFHFYITQIIRKLFFRWAEILISRSYQS